MPRSPAKPCTWPQGCPNLCVTGSRCPDHAKDRRPTAARRGYDTKWQRTRQAKLTATPYCEQPGCFKPATEVDHIDGLGPLGPQGHTPGNLRSYCHPHHSQRTARDQPGGWNQRG